MAHVDAAGDAQERPMMPRAIEGVIFGRRSLGRKLAFADVALSNDGLSAFDDTDGCGGESSEEGRQIRLVFVRQSFLGPLDSSLLLEGEDTSYAHILDEPFPTKMSSLPYGAAFTAQLGRCQQVPSKDGSGRLEHVWEVSKWKIREHPRELAEQSASLEQRAPLETGSGAMSCSNYLKARKEAHQLAQRHKIYLTQAKGGAANASIVSPGDRNGEKESKPSKANNELTATDLSDIHHGGKQAKAKRARIFASWVLETFFGSRGSADGDLVDGMFCQPCSIDAEDSTGPSMQNVHVLDIAGGKGQLSLELVAQQMASMSSIRKCTIIDPLVRKGDEKQRQARLKRARSRVEWLRQERQNEMSSISNTDADNGNMRLPPDVSIEHLAACFTVESFPQLKTKLAEDQTLMLLGLHPDQCTEDILDAALEHNLSVAVVPCCVFPDLFPSRRMLPRRANDVDHSGNASVRTYDDFLQYLLAKDDGLQMTTLPFAGKNKVIWRDVKWSD
ncbi:hypothetical protein ACHAXT_012442 [Thalassiosira profunda]